MMRIKYNFKLLFICTYIAIFSYTTAQTTEYTAARRTSIFKNITSSAYTTSKENINFSDIFPVPNQQTVCVNKGGHTHITLTCNDTGKVIGVHSVVLGYMDLNEICTDANIKTCQTGDNTSCCEQNLSTGQYGMILSHISGNTFVKNLVLPFQAAFGRCNDGLARTDSDYSVVSYDCIEAAAIHTMCRASNGSNDTLYVHSDSYPDKVGIAGQCSCEINTHPQQTLVVQMYDNRIDRGQSLEILDGNTIHAIATWQQDTRFNHIETKSLTSHSNLLRLKWRGGIIPVGTNKGQFWLRIKATDGTPVSIQCFEPESPRYYREIGDAIPATQMNRQCGYKDFLPLSIECNPGVIALHSVKNGFFSNGAICIAAEGHWNSSTQSANMCEQIATTYMYLGIRSDPNDFGVLQMYSGQSYSQRAFTRNTAVGACHSGQADYIVAYYDCIDGTSVQPMCTASSRVGNTIYVWNQGYPAAGDMEIRTCDCVIHTTASQFYVQVYDNRLNCSQRLELREADTTVMFLKCDDQFRHIQTYFVKTSGTPLTLHWKGINGTNMARLGKFWIRIQATDKLPMRIDCFEPVYPTTTTSATTTTPTARPYTKNEPNDKQTATFSTPTTDKLPMCIDCLEPVCPTTTTSATTTTPTARPYTRNDKQTATFSTPMCPPYTYGPNCRGRCRVCKGNWPCDTTTGECPGGVEPGHTEEHVAGNQGGTSSECSLVTPLVYGLVGVIVCLVVTVIFVSIFLIRYMRTAQKYEATCNVYEKPTVTTTASEMSFYETLR